MVSSGLLRRMALVRTLQERNIPEDIILHFIFLYEKRNNKLFLEGNNEHCHLIDKEVLFFHFQILVFVNYISLSPDIFALIIMAVRTASESGGEHTNI
jgi:hypothetical protein